MDKFLENGIGFIQWEVFYCVEGGGVSDGCDVESESDRNCYNFLPCSRILPRLCSMPTLLLLHSSV